MLGFDFFVRKSKEESKMDMKMLGLGGVSGGGLVAIVAIAALYIFGGGQSSQEGISTGTIKVFEVSSKGERLCTDLLKIRDLTEENKKTIVEAQACFAQINMECKLVAGFLNVDLSKPVEVVKEIPAEVVKEVKEVVKVVEEVKKDDPVKVVTE